MVFAQLRLGQFDLFRQIPGCLQIMMSVHWGLIEGVELGATLTGRQISPAPICGNCQQPRLEVTLHIPALQASEHADKGFLGSVFGVLAMAQHAVAESEDGCAEPVHKLPHGELVTLLAAANELADVFGQRPYPGLVFKPLYIFLYSYTSNFPSEFQFLP